MKLLLFPFKLYMHCRRVMYMSFCLCVCARALRHSKAEDKAHCTAAAYKERRPSVRVRPVDRLLSRASFLPSSQQTAKEKRQSAADKKLSPS